MGLADEVRHKAEERERAAREQSADDNKAANRLFDILDEIAPEAVIACEERKYPLQEVLVGPTGLTKKGWVIPVDEAEGEGSSAIVFYPDADWTLAERAPLGSVANFKAIGRWFAVDGSSRFLLGAEKAQLEAVISQVLLEG